MPRQQCVGLKLGVGGALLNSETLLSFFPRAHKIYLVSSAANDGEREAEEWWQGASFFCVKN
jgi:hypothetical protein